MKIVVPDELRRLKGERPEIVEAIEAARAHGDLSENAEYHAAKERQGHVEATIADDRPAWASANAPMRAKARASQRRTPATTSVTC